MTSINSIRPLCLIIMVLTFFMGASVAIGAGQSSENYTMEIDVFDGGGGWCTSTNYAISHATGQSTPIGYSEGSSYRVYAGYWYAALWYLPFISTQEAVILVPSALGFGEVGVGGTRTMSLMMNNTKETAIGVGTVSDPAGPYTKTGDWCSNTTLNPGDTCTIRVQFSPTVGGIYDSYFEIPTDDPEAGTLQVDLLGMGVGG